MIRGEEKKEKEVDIDSSVDMMADFENANIDNIYAEKLWKWA